MAAPEPEPAGQPAAAAAPAARRDDVVDVVHGVQVADPYRWLEDGDAADTQAWVAEQNRHTRAVLDAMPTRTW
jgi:prolyl oligopeptidase